MARLTAADHPNILIDDVTDWLMSEALGEPDVEHLVEGTAARSPPRTTRSAASTAPMPSAQSMAYRSSPTAWRYTSAT